ncbi:O-antigen ligase family protein [Enterococcus gallinarum]|uniref:O-antigen ligase family protein n=1 Tax=Enterococcus gallinarum TaxID=1353 RepID=UPI002954A38D|nr:O-antigen ligase family protein [Enterococcus gallinarum]MDV7785565.1 O-antigen ligase family protein [Enterococcus gallinarum]
MNNLNGYQRKTIKEDVFFKINILLLAFFLYFWYIFSLKNQVIYLLILVFFMFLKPVFMGEVLRFKKSSYIFMLLILYLSFKLFFDEFQTNSIVYIILFSCALFIKVFLDSSYNWEHFFLKSNLFFSSIHVFFSVIAITNKNFVINLNKIFLKGSTYWSNNGQFLRGTNPGITGQTGQNAFFICIFLCILTTYFLFNLRKNKGKAFFQSLFILLGFICLLTTGKRGHLLSIVLAFLVVLFLFFKKQKQYRKYFIVIVTLLLMGVIVLLNTSYFQIILLKFYSLLDSGDLTNGRLALWNYTIQLFENNPLIGTGFGSIREIFNMEAHNIYLQILAETGVIGFIIYIFLFISMFRESIKYYNSKNINVLISLFVQCFFLFYGLTGNPLYDSGFMLCYFVFCSLKGRGVKIYEQGEN